MMLVREEKKLSVTQVFHAFLRSSKAAASVEFALIMLILIPLFYGGYATFTLLQAKRTVERSTIVTAELASRMTKIDDEFLDKLFAVAASIVNADEDDKQFRISLTSVSVNESRRNNKSFRINWTEANHNDARMTAERLKNFKIPSVSAGKSVILVVAEFDHFPSFYHQWTGGQVTLREYSLRWPRNVSLIDR